jgi:PilZ domain
MPTASPRPQKPVPVLTGKKVAQLAAPGAEVTYVVLTPATKGDKRLERRWHTHLRVGKIVDGRTHVLSETQTRDLSARGARLRLASNIALPARIRFFDENSKTLREAAVAWQRGREIGVRFLAEIDPRGLSRAELFRLGIRNRLQSSELSSLSLS